MLLLELKGKGMLRAATTRVLRTGARPGTALRLTRPATTDATAATPPNDVAQSPSSAWISLMATTGALAVVACVAWDARVQALDVRERVLTEKATDHARKMDVERALMLATDALRRVEKLEAQLKLGMGERKP